MNGNFCCCCSLLSSLKMKDTAAAVLLFFPSPESCTFSTFSTYSQPASGCTLVTCWLVDNDSQRFVPLALRRLRMSMWCSWREEEGRRRRRRRRDRRLETKQKKGHIWLRRCPSEEEEEERDCYQRHRYCTKQQKNMWSSQPLSLSHSFAFIQDHLT